MNNTKYLNFKIEIKTSYFNSLKSCLNIIFENKDSLKDYAYHMIIFSLNNKSTFRFVKNNFDGFNQFVPLESSLEKGGQIFAFGINFFHNLINFIYNFIPFSQRIYQKRSNKCNGNA
jgi:hypothetical protein